MVRWTLFRWKVPCAAFTSAPKTPGDGWGCETAAADGNMENQTKEGEYLLVDFPHSHSRLENSPFHFVPFRVSTVPTAPATGFIKREEEKTHTWLFRFKRMDK